MKAKLTRSRYQRLSLAERAQAYWDHNMVQPPEANHNVQGPSLIAQTMFWDNWQCALRAFEDGLPSN